MAKFILAFKRLIKTLISLTKENVEVPTDNTYVNSYIDENNDLTALTHDNQTIVLAKGTKVTLE